MIYIPTCPELVIFLSGFFFLVFLLENHYDTGKTVYKGKFSIFTFSGAYTLMSFFSKCVLKVKYFFVSSKHVLLIIDADGSVYYLGLLSQDTFENMKYKCWK